MTHKNILSEITTSIFKNPNSFKSSEFIVAYNFIYQRCTAPTSLYEIKGREIYDHLLDITNNFTLNIMHYENTKDLHSILCKYESSIVSLRKVYHYLERFFIMVSIDRRDGYVMDIRTLCYTALYRNYLERTERKIFELLIFEIDNFKSRKCEKIAQVKYVIEILKNVYTSSDEDKKFKELIKTYITSIINKINGKPTLQDCIDCLFKKLKITSLIFDCYIVNCIQKKLIKSIAKRKIELVNLLLERTMLDLNIKDHYSCMNILDCHTILREKFEEMVKNKVDELENKNNDNANYALNEYICFYENLNNKINKECKEDSFLHKILDTVYSKINLNRFCSEILEIHNEEMKRQLNYSKVYTLTIFLNFLEDSKAEDTLLQNFQYRLLTNSHNNDFERFFIENLSKVKYFSLISKSKRCMRDIFLQKNYFVCKLEKYEEVDIEYRLLTNGFWMLEPQDIVPNKMIATLEANIKDKFGDRLLDKVIGFNYINSAILIEFNGYEILMNTLKYLILDLINNSLGISIDQINGKLNYDCIDEICALENTALIVNENSIYHLNKCYNGGDLNIFEIQMNFSKNSKNVKSRAELVRLKILKILKAQNNIDRNEIINYMGKSYIKDFEDALNLLIDKNQIIVEENMCKLNSDNACK